MPTDSIPAVRPAPPPMPLFGDAYRNRMVIAAMAMVIGVVGSCGLAGAYCTAPAPAPEVAR